MLTMRQWLFVALCAPCYPVPMDALPCYPVPLGAPRYPCAKAAPELGGGGRADDDRATLTVTPQTIYFFFQITQVANGFYLPVLQSFSTVC